MVGQFLFKCITTCEFSIGALLSVERCKSFFFLVLPKVVLRLSSPIVPVGSRLSCSATGIPPTYIAIIRDSTILVNTTSTASIRVNEEGNYTCRATSKYGTDEREFVAVIVGKETEIIHSFKLLSTSNIHYNCLPITCTECTVLQEKKARLFHTVSCL